MDQSHDMLPHMTTTPTFTPTTIKKKKTATGFTMGGMTTVKPPREVPGGWELKPASGRVAGAIFIGLLAAFWNGITWTMLIQTWRTEQGLFAGGITLFLSVFVLIGAAIAWGFIHQLLKAIFTPRLTLKLGHPRLIVGQETDLAWTITGSRHRLADLKISLVLREECQYRRGTDTVTDRHEAQATIAYEGSEPDADGRCTLILPPHAPPSFSVKSNQLVWAIRLTGTVSGLPDVDDEYPIAVDAAPTGNASIVAAPLPEGTELPDSSPLLVLTNNGVDVLPGTPVAGVVRAPGKAVTLRLRWATSGKGDQQGEIAARCDLAPNTAGFIMILPSLPPLWLGTVLSLTWHLEAEVDGALLASMTLTTSTPTSAPSVA